MHQVGQHWAEGVREVVLSIPSDSEPPFSISGGSENAAFLRIAQFKQENFDYLSQSDLQIGEDDLILELQNRTAAGLTSYDAQRLLEQICRTGGTLIVKLVKSGTTRAAKAGEIDGVDYRFITKEEFETLDRNGELLESGIYEGNFYGTPKPPKFEECELDTRPREEHIVEEDPLAETKSIAERRRSYRDDLREMAPLFVTEVNGQLGGSNATNMMVPPSTSGEIYNAYEQQNAGEAEHVPLPPNWEMAYTDSGERYFIDHNNGTTQWTDPRETMVDKKPNVATESEELPIGWEKVEDPEYGVYYVDHVNKRTQYEKPVATNGSAHKNTFTRNPHELTGEMLTSTLVKGPKGLGFTLVGNDGNSSEPEFLQIRKIIRNGPAHRDGRLRMGDILVYINNTCVLGYTQNDVIDVFQTIGIGESVNLRVCRGYPLMFDPNTNGSEFITQDAYCGSGSEASSSPMADLTSRAECQTVSIVKGDMGFGFTIADSPYGQKVKKIIDRRRCYGLAEGDVLCEINGNNVRKMSHAEIVDVLKDCPVGVEATLVIQRAGTMKRSQTDISVSLQKPPSVPAKPTNRPHSYHPAVNGTNGVNWDRRSKTPTAEMGHAHTGFATTEPPVRPRSKTPGPVPSRSAVKPNGFATSNGPRQQEFVDTSTVGGVPIYENLPRQYGDSHRVAERSKSPTPRSKTPSTSSFASATPNYVPASVYSRHYSGGGGQQTRGNNGKTTEPNAGHFSPTRASYSNEHEYVTVNLLRQQQGFGFRIVGGNDEQTQTSISEIVVGGAAYQDSRLRLGDEIMEIDGMSMLGATHQEAVRAMSDALKNGHVKLVVRRLRPGYTNSHFSSSMVPQETIRYQAGMTQSLRRQYPYDVTLMRNPSEGFGFQIISSVYGTGSCIGKIIEGSPADRCVALKLGDRIVAINNVNILHMRHEDIVKLIRDSGTSVTLTVGSPEMAEGEKAPIVTSSYVAPITREMTPMERRYSLASVIAKIERATPPSSETLEYQYSIMISDPPSPDRCTPCDPFGEIFDSEPFELEKATHDGEYITVELHKGSKGFGFSIRGGQDFGMPLFVLKIAEGGPAHMDGNLQVGDQLIEINGVSTVGMTHREAINLIRSENTPNELLVRLLVRRQANSPLDVSAFQDMTGEYDRLGYGLGTAPINSDAMLNGLETQWSNGLR